MRPKTSYLICSLPRSGSWLLGFALEDTGLAGHPYPFFCPRVMDYVAATYSLPSPPPVRDYLDAVFKDSMTPNGVFGAKVEWFDLASLLELVTGEWPAETDGNERSILEDLLGDVRIIYLERRDKVREAVSFSRALESQQWAQPKTPEAVPPGIEPESDRLDFDRLDALFELLTSEDAKWREFFGRNGYEPLTVAYEDSIRDQESFGAATRRVLDYLGITVPPDFVPPEPRQQRQSDQASEEIVRRYRERRARMAGPEARS